MFILNTFFQDNSAILPALHNNPPCVLIPPPSLNTGEAKWHPMWGVINIFTPRGFINMSDLYESIEYKIFVLVFLKLKIYDFCSGVYEYARGFIPDPHQSDHGHASRRGIRLTGTRHHAVRVQYGGSLNPEEVENSANNMASSPNRFKGTVSRFDK